MWGKPNEMNVINREEEQLGRSILDCKSFSIIHDKT